MNKRTAVDAFCSFYGNLFASRGDSSLLMLKTKNVSLKEKITETFPVLVELVWTEVDEKIRQNKHTHTQEVLSLVLLHRTTLKSER